MTDETKKTGYSPFAAFTGYEQGKDTLARKPRDDNESYGNYLFGSAFEADDGSKKSANWSSFTGSRMLVRLGSRGLLGSTLYTLANHEIPRQMRGYDPTIPLKALGDPSKFYLRYIARFFDTVYGKPLGAAVKLIAPAEKAEEWAENVLWFRNKNDYANPFGRPGRSLGDEVTAMSFDFAAGSVGDATGRYIATCLDPNVDKKWNKDGHFDAKEFAKETASEAWKIFSKNQGEDWAAALPYVYQMKFQRQAIGNLYPGFKLSSDRQLNGGSWRVNADGKIIESYTKAGALDLQLRFSGYNWYTLMYRDAYDAVSEKIKDWRHGEKQEILADLSDMSDAPVQSSLAMVGHGVRYAAKSLIKSAIYMTPSVPFFWITRTPQTKFKGIGVYAPGQENRESGGYVAMPNGKAYSLADSTTLFDASNRVLQPSDSLSIGGRALNAPEMGLGFDPFAPEHTRGVFDSFTAPFGRGCYKAGETMYKGMTAVGFSETAQNRRFAHDWMNASLSYTPYMIAKAETALRWDRPLMDKAIYRFIDGISSLNVHEVLEGASDIREQIVHPPTNRTIEEFTREQERQEAEERQERELHKSGGRDKENNGADKAGSATPKTQVEGVSHQSKANKIDTRAAATSKSNAPAAAWQEQFRNDTSAPPGVTLH